jgi:prevent-host-death family protein
MVRTYEAPRSRRRGSTGPRGRESVAAAEFKARCLELMDRVRETGAEYVVTKHGVPVAKLVPYVPPKRPSFFGSMKGTLLKYERPFDPIDGEYDINRR